MIRVVVWSFKIVAMLAVTGVMLTITAGVAEILGWSAWLTWPFGLAMALWLFAHDETIQRLIRYRLSQPRHPTHSPQPGPHREHHELENERYRALDTQD